MLYVLTNAYTTDLEYVQLTPEAAEELRAALHIDVALHRAVGPDLPCQELGCTEHADHTCIICKQVRCSGHIYNHDRDEFCALCRPNEL